MNKQKTYLDFSKFPSMEKGCLLAPRPPEKLKGYPEIYDRCCAAIYMACRVSDDSHKLVITTEAQSAAYLRASLMEFIGLEDICKKTFGKNPSLLIYETDNPLFHIMKILRNYNVHIASASFSSENITVIVKGSAHPHTIEYISNLDVNEIRKVDNISEHYHENLIKNMVFTFDQEQRKLGVSNLILKGILLYCCEIVNFLKNQSLCSSNST